jgi:hypothetical protein
MSTELYLRCSECAKAIHFATRYASGVKLFTIGATKEQAEGFVGKHVCCNGIEVLDEHDDRVAGLDP